MKIVKMPDKEALFGTASKSMEKKNEKTEESQLKGSTLYAGKLNTMEDDAVLKKIQAQKKAMKVLLDTHERMMKMDEGEESARQYVKELDIAAKEAEGQIERIDQAKETLKENGSPEEYEEMSKEMDEMRKIWEDRANTAIQGQKSVNKGIANVKMEQLKSNPMVESKREAEAITEAAGEKFIDALRVEGKEKADEKQKENVEKIEEQKEKQEEKEKALKNTTLDKAEKVPAESTGEIQNTVAKQEEIQREVENMLRDQKMLEEDLKGLSVDEQI
ncbi:MAG: hypothetical protein RSJ40_04705 [Acetivibrio sp.]